ncbi:MAG: TRAFs-binding domain-containing protein [Pseudomonadota bacterium]
MVRPSSADLKFTMQTLRSASILKSIDDSDLEELARCAKPIAIKPGKEIVAPGLSDRPVALIQTGVAAAIRRLQPGGRAALTALFGRRDVAGFVSALAPGAAEPNDSEGDDETPTVRPLVALTNLSAYAVAPADIQRLLRRSDELSEAVLQDLALRLDQAGALIAQTVFRPLEIRLASFFSRIVELNSSDDWNPIVPIGQIPQSTIAELLGVSREHINRTLMMWERSGLIFQSRNGGMTIQNRKRLAALAANDRENAQDSFADDWLWEIDAHLDCGLNQTAYHLAMEAAKRTPKDVKVRHRAVLAAARAGGPQKALEEFDALKLEKEYADEDVACLKPRLLRDIAFLENSMTPDTELLQKSAHGYREAFENCRGYYSGVNAAAGYALIGDKKKAREIADKVKIAIDERVSANEEDADSYFVRASLAECALVSGDKKAASSLFERACHAKDVTAGKRATTRKQLARLAPHVGIDEAWIDSVTAQPKVLFFSGPLAHKGVDDEEALEHLGEAFENFLDNEKIGRATGALAGGADIVIAERLLDAGIELDVYLPLPPIEFLKSSVRIGGDGWEERFLFCMRRAASIEWNRHGLSPTVATFTLGAQVAMGKAIRQASQLDTDAIGFFAGPKVNDGRNGVSVSNLNTWSARGLEHIKHLGDWPTKTVPDTNETMQTVYALIIETVDPKKPITFEPFEHKSVQEDKKRNLRAFLFPDIPAALKNAEAIAEATDAKNARIWLDAGISPTQNGDGPSFENLRDTLSTAKCLPGTEPGRVFASDLFVGAAHIAIKSELRFEYAGFASTREKLEPCPLYLMG